MCLLAVCAVAPGSHVAVAQSPSFDAAVADAAGGGLPMFGEAPPPGPPVALRRRVFVGLPTATSHDQGQMRLTPNVNVVAEPEVPRGPEQAVFQTSGYVQEVPSPVFPPQGELGPFGPAPLPLGAEILPPAMNEPLPDASTPIFADVIAGAGRPRRGGLRSWLAGRNIEGGVGRERLPHAPFELDSSQPLGNLRFRVNSVNNTPFPDRSEYLWARTNGGRGPRLVEPNLDYQELRTQLELGSPKFSTATEFPLRWTNPNVNRNHAGLGDLKLTVKTVIVDGQTWQITQMFRSYFNTGSPSMGLGTGHIAMEPGALVRYRYSDVTMLHGELKFNFPIAGDRSFAGQLLNYGLGVSHVLVDRDAFAVLSTLEMPATYVTNGQKTNPNGTISDAEGEHILSLFPGLRFVRDCGGDLGVFECGISSGWPISSPRFYDSVLRFDVRWSY